MTGQCCGRVIAATLEETLECPGDWHWLPGVGWIHDAPLRRTVTGAGDLDTGTEAVVIAAARAAWQRACHRNLEAADDLIRALDTYDAICAGVISPSAYWPDLRGDPEPYGTALRRAAEEVLRLLARIIGIAPALAGDAP